MSDRETLSELELPMYDRRGTRRPQNNWRGFWQRHLRPSEILALAILGGMVLTVVDRLRVNLEPRVIALEHRVDSLAGDLKFTNYMLCVQQRRTDPAAVPPDCAPIFQARARP